MASCGSATLLPPVKSVMVYRNGDPFYSGRRFVVNHRQVSTMEAFLNDVTHCIQAPLAVRTLYTPRQGHRVRELHDLQTGAQYVAAGFERFKKLDYLNTGLKKQPVPMGEGARARLLHRPNVSAKWRKYIPLPCIIHVFRNEDLRCLPFRFIIPRTWQHDLDQILGLVTEKASLRTGAVRRLCTLEGVTVSSADELVSGQFYVAVGAERFKKLPYVELLVPKASERNYPGNRRLSRRYKGRKAASGPEDSYSDSALLDSPELDGRRVKSTGDEVGETALPSIQRSPVKEESSIFYAKPVKVRVRNRGHPRPPPRTGPAQDSVFRAVRRKREEVQGAEEVLEDENTAVDVPVDQGVLMPSTGHLNEAVLMPSTGHLNEAVLMPSTGHLNEAVLMPSTGHLNEAVLMPSTGHLNEAVLMPSTGHLNEAVLIPSTGHLNEAVRSLQQAP
uniref:Doublecortin domain containing 2B n=1 Tax=Salmo trutta TaxID=8032 RepID=A0A673ZJP6_SALTR